MFNQALAVLPLANLSFAVQNSNLAGKSIVICLLLGSIGAWSVMIAKYRELGNATRQSKRFLAAYRREVSPVALYLNQQENVNCPLCAVYRAACKEIEVSLESRGIDPQDLFAAGASTPHAHLDKTQIAAVRNASERTVADQILMLEGNMGIIATATTTAPFLGLLGTVWGVMDSFAGMASKGTAMLSAVAPGISGALLTTVIGLLVALPSAIGYNFLTNTIRRLSVQSDNFAQEVAADIERHLGQ